MKSTVVAIAAHYRSKPRLIPRKSRSATAPIVSPAPARRFASRFRRRQRFQDDRAANALLKKPRKAATGARRRSAPKCGSPIYSTTPGDGPKDSYMVRVGILRQRDQLPPKQQIWARSAQSSVNGLAVCQRARRSRAQPTCGNPGVQILLDYVVCRHWRRHSAGGLLDKKRICLVNANDTTRTNGYRPRLDGCRLLPQMRRAATSTLSPLSGYQRDVITDITNVSLSTQTGSGLGSNRRVSKLDVQPRHRF